MYSHGFAQLPWGGTKRSGVGVTHSKFGFYACVQPKLLSIDSGRIPVPFWYPYDQRLRRGVDAILRALYSPSAGEKLRTVLGERSQFKDLLDRARNPNGTPV